MHRPHTEDQKTPEKDALPKILNALCQIIFCEEWAGLLGEVPLHLPSGEMGSDVAGSAKIG